MTVDLDELQGELADWFRGRYGHDPCDQMARTTAKLWHKVDDDEMHNVLYFVCASMGYGAPFTSSSGIWSTARVYSESGVEGVGPIEALLAIYCGLAPVVKPAPKGSTT